MKYLLLILTLVFSLTFFEGCGSTPVQTSIKADAVVISTVNGAMTAWKSYVNSGSATQAQVDSVKNAYNTYYNAQMIVKGALEISLTTTNSNSADVASANSAVTNAENALIALVTQFIKK